MDTQSHHQRADRSLSLAKWGATLLLALALACLGGTGARADCGRSSGNSLPPLPILTPAADGTLSLTIRAERAPFPIMIGDVPVTDVPIFLVQPDAGTRLRAVDAFGRPTGDLPARCLIAPETLYAGSIWALQQGDRLHVTLTSALDFHAGELPAATAGGMDCDGINLHTHGLLVSPARRSEADGSRSIGDQAFDIAVPAGTMLAGGDPCATDRDKAPMTMGADMPQGTDADTLHYAIEIPGKPGQSRRDDGEHPSGLFWFHPHTHGYSGPLSAGGMTGLITIGRLGDYLCVDTPGGCVAPDALPVRMMVLKDAQVVPEKDGWRLSHNRIYPLEDACAQSAGRDEDRRGECRDYRGRRWLFTVNGARYPQITDAAPGRPEIWRIVNASPNMTYRLRLRSLDDARAKPLTMQVLTLEGAAPAPSRPVAPESVGELLLMPASRAEIIVTPPAVGGAYALEQQPFTTGGDNWPRVLLAALRVPATNNRSASNPVSMRLRAVSSTRQPAGERFYGPTAMPSCDFPAGSIRRILLVARPTFSDDRRRPTKFGLIAGLERPGSSLEAFDAAGKPVPMNRETWNGLLAGDADAPAFMHNPLGTVCTYLGHTETWIIDNYTAEAHSFHIHQTEFRMAEAHRSDPAFFSPEPSNGLGEVQRSSDAAIEMDDTVDRAGGGTTYYRDTVPVPRGQSAGGRGCDGSPFNDHCHPGRITIIVRFDRAAQVGTFVYHCHILQHEDAGMMATIRVMPQPR
jgi:FtsP/CotA-like multicopper oxidase with cupredoxin domain